MEDQAKADLARGFRGLIAPLVRPIFRAWLGDQSDEIAALRLKLAKVEEWVDKQDPAMAAMALEQERVSVELAAEKSKLDAAISFAFQVPDKLSEESRS